MKCFHCKTVTLVTVIDSGVAFHGFSSTVLLLLVIAVCLGRMEIVWLCTQCFGLEYRDSRVLEHSSLVLDLIILSYLHCALCVYYFSLSSWYLIGLK